jgi:hypothetical protein
VFHESIALFLLIVVNTHSTYCVCTRSYTRFDTKERRKKIVGLATLVKGGLYIAKLLERRSRDHASQAEEDGCRNEEVSRIDDTVLVQI